MTLDLAWALLYFSNNDNCDNCDNWDIAMSRIDDRSKLLTAEEISTELRIPKSTLYKLCNDGQIPAAKIGKHWRFDRAKVDQWLAAQFEAHQTGGREAQAGARPKHSDRKRAGK